MANYEYIKYEVNKDIATITLNRPGKHNAINVGLLDNLKDAFQRIYDNKEIRGVIVTGEGEKSFSAGADIKEITELNELNGRKFSENGQEVMALIEDCPKPVIAAVNGFAVGGGCELAMACHMRVATEDARFGLTEVNLGMIPGFGGTQRITQLIGKGKAMELMMTCDLISGTEAKQLGLVNHLVSSKEEMMYKAERMLDKIIAKAPLAVGMIVTCVNAFYASDENGFQTEANSFSNAFKTKDFKEGTTAFVEKRDPKFTGE